ncbi:hypothetical protein VP01_3709g1 [Puccinia sorghi]|uniref:Uncharacterized protein n=1 Tax=Puccinia sorghi TaxID=27349 RepID=A0A0L6UUX7_9BASI|nr:hypothetical protein VP01_3709g1 [Puccinia sorghi]
MILDNWLDRIVVSELLIMEKLMTPDLFLQMYVQVDCSVSNLEQILESENIFSITIRSQATCGKGKLNGDISLIILRLVVEYGIWFDQVQKIEKTCPAHTKTFLEAGFRKALDGRQIVSWNLVGPWLSESLLTSESNIIMKAVVLAALSTFLFVWMRYLLIDLCDFSYNFLEIRQLEIMDLIISNQRDMCLFQISKNICRSCNLIIKFVALFIKIDDRNLDKSWDTGEIKISSKRIDKHWSMAFSEHTKSFVVFFFCKMSVNPQLRKVSKEFLCILPTGEGVAGDFPNWIIFSLCTFVNSPVSNLSSHSQQKRRYDTKNLGDLAGQSAQGEFEKRIRRCSRKGNQQGNFYWQERKEMRKVQDQRVRSDLFKYPRIGLKIMRDFFWLLLSTGGVRGYCRASRKWKELLSVMAE